MAHTDEDLIKTRQRIEKLREKVQTEEATRNTLFREADNDVVMAQLDAEEKRLNQQLETAKENTKAARVAVKDTVRSFGDTAPVEPIADGAATTPTGGTPETSKDKE